MVTHLIHQREVDALEVVVLGALDEEGVEGVVGGEEGVGVVRGGVLPHFALEAAKLGEIVSTALEVARHADEMVPFQSFAVRARRSRTGSP